MTVSISRLESGVSFDVAARAIAIGVLANTFLKLGLVAGIGAGRFRRVAIGGLSALAAASGVGLILFMLYASG